MASRIDGTAIAKGIREGLKTEIEKTQETNPRFKPSLVIFQGKRSHPASRFMETITNLQSDIVGNRSDSSGFNSKMRYSTT